jgi:hypothetical protein
MRPRALIGAFGGVSGHKPALLNMGEEEFIRQYSEHMSNY